MTHSQAVWRAFREDNLTVEDLGERFDLKREKVRQILVIEQTREQKRCDDYGCRPGIHEPPCPRADPVELALHSDAVSASETPK